jgi:hypothetical protein
MLENEEVQKSQVLLAAQDMIDSIQKMIVDISKMKVEELPAVVTGINNEIGSSEGQQFEGTVMEALAGLEQALAATKSSLTGSLDQISSPDGSQLAPGAFGGGEEMPVGDELGGAEMPMGDELGDEEMPADIEEPEEDLGGAGRGMR